MAETNSSSWYTRPVFISSTFNDMQAERDWLRDIVFKGLSQELKGMQVDLEPVDLRWGVETKSESETESQELLVLKVCQDEIERCCKDQLSVHHKFSFTTPKPSFNGSRFGRMASVII
jgi:hypothetical protein